MTVLYDLVGFTTGTLGQGNMAVAAAIPGFVTPAQISIPNATQVRYVIKEGNDREIGVGTYTTSGALLSRDTVGLSIISGVAGTTKMDLTGTAEVYLSVSADDLNNWVAFGATFTLPTTDGSAGQVLRTDGAGVLSFGAATGGLVPISTATISNVANVDIELTGGYSAYFFRFEQVTVQTDGVDFVFRTSTDGGSSFDSGASDYQWRLGAPDGTSGGVDGADVYAKILSGAGNASGESINGEMKLYVSDGTNHTGFTSSVTFKTTAGNFQTIDSGGGRSSATAITDIRFLASSGNLVSGKIHLYGFADGA